MKIINRKNKGFISCVPDMFLGTVFIVVAGMVICYAYSSEQEKVLANQNMTTIINKDKVEMKKQNK